MGSRLLLNVREAYYSHDVMVTENALSTIQWQQRNTDCVMMDSFPNTNHRASTILTTLPELDKEWLSEESQPGPSSSTSTQIKARSKVTFDTCSTP
jgi:hypothetical protein